jgi:hypothetical protein
MPVFGPAKAQRARQRIDRRSGRRDGASLLEPDVPVDADAGEVATSTRRKPGVRRRRPEGSPTSFGVSFCRRDRRKSPSSLCLKFVPVSAMSYLAQEGRVIQS